MPVKSHRLLVRLEQIAVALCMDDVAQLKCCLIAVGLGVVFGFSGVREVCNFDSDCHRLAHRSATRAAQMRYAADLVPSSGIPITTSDRPNFIVLSRVHCAVTSPRNPQSIHRTLLRPNTTRV